MSLTCTCTNLKCPIHPTKHDKGCTPCISKNLRLREIPNCFFNLVGNADLREGDSFTDFAKLTMIDAKDACTPESQSIEHAKPGDISYVGLILSKQTVSKGDKLNFMLLLSNLTQTVLQENVRVYIQNSEDADSECIVVDEANITCPVDEGKHAYFSVEMDFEVGEYIIFCGENEPRHGISGVNGVSGIFFIE